MKEETMNKIIVKIKIQRFDLNGIIIIYKSNQIIYSIYSYR